MGEQRESISTKRALAGEQSGGTLVSDWSRVDLGSGTYIYIIYTPNLGLAIAIPGREREQGRFRGSSEGAGGSIGGARGSTEGAPREHR